MLTLHVILLFLTQDDFTRLGRSADTHTTFKYTIFKKKQRDTVKWTNVVLIFYA